MRDWLTTLHLVGMALWTGGLLALARLLAVHAVEPPSVRPTLRRLMWRAGYLVAWPGALATLASGALLVRLNGWDWLRVSLWMQAKLGLVGVLLLAHLGTTAAQRRIARRDPERAPSRGWGWLTLLVLIALAGAVALSVYRPFVGGR